jgi:hypothetical protein
MILSTVGKRLCKAILFVRQFCMDSENTDLFYYFGFKKQSKTFMG